MTINLHKYLTEQYISSIAKGEEPGPVVTISRQYGCSAKEIAKLLSEKLNEFKKKSKNREWTWVNKEIFDGTSKALNLKHSRILHVFEGQKKSMIEDIIISSVEKYYVNDGMIKRKIIEIARSFAEKGNVIIIGLGGVAITRDIKKSLHVKLQAPFEWRVKQAAVKNSKSIEETTLYAKKTDENRDNLRKSFFQKSEMEELFDLTFNTMTVSHEEIVESIISVMKLRGMI